MIGLSLVSCDYGKVTHTDANIEIYSQELRDAILEYDSMLHLTNCTKGYLLTVYETIQNDSLTKFSIVYSVSTTGMQNQPIQLADVNGKDVVFIQVRKPDGLLITNRILQMELARRHFPEEYKILSAGKHLKGIISNHTPEMDLIFCNGELIYKRLPIKEEWGW